MLRMFTHLRWIRPSPEKHAINKLSKPHGKSCETRLNSGHKEQHKEKKD